MGRWHAGVWNGQAIGIGESRDAAREDAKLAIVELDPAPHIDEVRLVPIPDEMAVMIQSGKTDVESLGLAWVALDMTEGELRIRLDAFERAIDARSRDAAIGELKAIEFYAREQLDRMGEHEHTVDIHPLDLAEPGGLEVHQAATVIARTLGWEKTQLVALLIERAEEKEKEPGLALAYLIDALREVWPSARKKQATEELDRAARKLVAEEGLDEDEAVEEAMRRREQAWLAMVPEVEPSN
jgi:hypothetical protein